MPQQECSSTFDPSINSQNKESIKHVVNTKKIIARIYKGSLQISFTYALVKVTLLLGPYEGTILLSNEEISPSDDALR